MLGGLLRNLTGGSWPDSKHNVTVVVGLDWFMTQLHHPAEAGILPRQVVQVQNAVPLSNEGRHSLVAVGKILHAPSSASTSRDRKVSVLPGTITSGTTSTTPAPAQPSAPERTKPSSLAQMPDLPMSSSPTGQVARTPHWMSRWSTHSKPGSLPKLLSADRAGHELEARFGEMTKHGQPCRLAGIVFVP